jgi:SPP1 family predicted phage head-tail adaptor
MRKNFASALRQVIKIQEPIIHDDQLGDMLENWKDFLIVRAEVQALYDKSGGEAFVAMQLMDASFYRFRIRFIQGIKSNMRILYLGRVFQIKRIINQDEMNMILVIIAQESL